MSKEEKLEALGNGSTGKIKIIEEMFHVQKDGNESTFYFGVNDVHNYVIKD